MYVVTRFGIYSTITLLCMTCQFNARYLFKCTYSSTNSVSLNPNFCGRLDTSLLIIVRINSGKFSRAKFFADGSKNEKFLDNFCGSWLTMQNKNTIMPNLWIIFLWIVGQLLNPQIFCFHKNFPLYCIDKYSQGLLLATASVMYDDSLLITCLVDTDE